MHLPAAEEAVRLFHAASAGRQVAPSRSNQRSSRSHLVFTCTVTSSSSSGGVTHARRSKLIMVDLAGGGPAGAALPGPRMCAPTMVLPPHNLCAGTMECRATPCLSESHVSEPAPWHVRRRCRDAHGIPLPASRQRTADS